MAKRGRKSKPEPERLVERLSVRLPAADFDELCRRAAEARVELRVFVRRILRAAVGIDVPGNST